MGLGSGMTRWRRLRDWQEASVWAQMHVTLMEQLAQADRLAWSRASDDSGSVSVPLAKKGRQRQGQSVPTRPTEANQAPNGM